MPDDPPAANVERYQRLVVVMNELTAITEIEQIGDYVVHAAKKLVEAEIALLFVPDPTDQTLILEAGTFPAGVQAPEIALPIAGSMEGWATTQMLPVIANDRTATETEKGGWIKLASITTKTALILPANFQGKAIFVLEVLNKQAGEFTHEDQEVLAYLCQHTTICLERLHQLSQSDLIPELVHELRTPLAALNTALQLLLRTDLPIEKREHITRMIQSEFNRLADLTTSFLDYSRLKSGREKYRHSHFDLKELICDSLELMQTQFEYKKMKYSLELPEQPLILWADRDKIKQVILNLMSNAVKYNQEGSSVTIKANATPKLVSFSLTDDGQGIPSENLPHLFERFYRLPSTEGQIKGTGLGLAICKHIVEAHHGRIVVSSTFGKGSTFTVQLPTSERIVL